MKTRFPLGAKAVIVVVVLLLLGILFIPRFFGRGRLDGRTNCPIDDSGRLHPKSATAIYLDTSDPVEEVSRERIRLNVRGLLTSLDRDDLVLLYLSKEIGTGSGNVGDRSQDLPFPPLVELCHPGRPDAVNPIWEGKAWIRHLFDKFNDAFRVIGGPFPEAPQSPLLENIQMIALRLLDLKLSVGPGEPADEEDGGEHVQHGPEITKPQHLIVISNLLQNSEELTVLQNWRPCDGFSELEADVAGLEVQIWPVNHDMHRTVVDEDDLKACWKTWFEDQGATVKFQWPMDALSDG